MASSSGTITPLLNTSSAVLYALPPGKPDVSTPPTPGTPVGEDHRPRIKQAGQQQSGGHILYALNYLRTRIGPHAPAELLHARQIEQRCSLHRKEFNRLTPELNRLERQWLNKVLQQFSPGGGGLEVLRANLESIRHYLAEGPVVPSQDLLKALFGNRYNDITQQFGAMSLVGDIVDDSPAEREAKKKVLQFIERFCDQNAVKDIGIFLGIADASKEGAIHIKFLETMGAEPILLQRLRVMLSHHEFLALDHKILQQLPREYLSKTRTLAQAAMLQALGFKKAHWTADGTISELNKALTEHGPLIVNAKLGLERFPNHPVYLKVIQERGILGWEAQGDAVPVYHQTTVATQPLVIVGATSSPEEGDWVYYVNPQVDSTAAPGMPRIFMVPYSFFAQSIVNSEGLIHSMLSKDALAKISSSSDIAHAYYYAGLPELPSSGVSSTSTSSAD